MSDWTIRPATPSDAFDIADVAVAGWRQAYADILPPDHLTDIDVHERAERIRSRWGGKTRTAVAELDGAVVGFVGQYLECRLEGFDAEIGALYVHPRVGRGGIGRGLVRYALMEWIMPSGMSTLGIMTLRDNSIGRAFYEAIGGEVVEAAEWMYRDCTYAAVWYGFRDLAATLERCGTP
ncbi:MAG: hypothetical protein HONBIEJF_00734 [Fimbriimonadaceae bacterium]|nr:hypothetical protein [Fimbriimonadaceae bacterium]